MPPPSAAAPAPPPAHLACPMCNIRRGCYVLVTCNHMGPCTECAPTVEEVVRVYGACNKCSKPVDANKMIKFKG